MRKTATTLGNIIAKGKAQDLTVTELKEALENEEGSSEAKGVIDQITYMSQNVKGSTQYLKTKGNQSTVS